MSLLKADCSPFMSIEVFIDVRYCTRVVSGGAGKKTFGLVDEDLLKSRAHEKIMTNVKLSKKLR